MTISNQIQIKFREKKSSVLTPSTLGCLAQTATVNMTCGCAHQCLYCYTRGYSIFPGDKKVVVYSNLLQKIQEDFAHKRKIPQLIYFSPSSDLFQPIPEVLEQGYEILSWLLNRNIRLSILTKGRIPDKFFNLFGKHSSQLQIQIGLISVDHSILSYFEPFAASVEERLDQIQRCIQLGIETRVRIDPIIPQITDDENSLQELCRQIKESGVKEISASVLFVRLKILTSLKRQLFNIDMRKKILSAFTQYSLMAINAKKSNIWALNLEERKKILDRITSVAILNDLKVHLCGCKNPDITKEHCDLAGVWKESQGSLFPLG